MAMAHAVKSQNDCGQATDASLGCVGLAVSRTAYDDALEYVDVLDGKTLEGDSEIEITGRLINLNSCLMGIKLSEAWSFN